MMDHQTASIFPLKVVDRSTETPIDSAHMLSFAPGKKNPCSWPKINMACNRFRRSTIPAWCPGIWFFAKTQMLSAKVTQKQGITARLTQLIMASEKKRDAKLNEIMKKMSVEEGGSVSGSAPNSGGASYM